MSALGIVVLVGLLLITCRAIKDQYVEHIAINWIATHPHQVLLYGSVGMSFHHDLPKRAKGRLFLSVIITDLPKNIMIFDVDSTFSFLGRSVRECIVEHLLVKQQQQGTFMRFFADQFEVHV